MDNWKKRLAVKSVDMLVNAKPMRRRKVSSFLAGDEVTCPDCGAVMLLCTSTPDGLHSWHQHFKEQGFLLGGNAETKCPHCGAAFSNLKKGFHTEHGWKF